MDLRTGIFRPFMKENDKPLYVDKNSNHPPLVLQNIPKGINSRLSRISSNKEVFDAAKTEYQEALSRSGYDFQLYYNPETKTKNGKRNRRRKVTWFNPPYSANIKTNVGKEFLNLVDKCFPKSNPLHKVFNRQTLKIRITFR